MTTAAITTLVNTLLAGEQLTYLELKPHLDTVIDDINAQLNSTYPIFSKLPVGVDAYIYFPDEYIRSVVCYGAAYYFYLFDEEGAPTAMGYAQRYKQKMFEMVRDFLHAVPTIFQACSKSGYIEPGEVYADSSMSGLGLERI
jgi:hypothetical protein